MNTRQLISVAALLFGAAVSRPLLPAPAALPVPGPGGVATAVLDFLARQDAAADVGGLLVDHRHGVDFAVEHGRLGQVVDGAGTQTFFDVAADGVPVAAADAAAFAKLLSARVARDAKAATALRSEVRSIQANCDAETCSLAIVTFDRHYTDAAGAQRSVPMQATALLSYDREAPGGAFRIWHWHASRRPAEVPAARAGR
ncbi:MAG: hypothetical protein R3F29_12910 [Planctomycetota bacterium]